MPATQFGTKDSYKSRGYISLSYRSTAIRRPDKFSAGSVLIRSAATSPPQLHIFALQDDVLMDKHSHTVGGISFPCRGHASHFELISPARFRGRKTTRTGIITKCKYSERWDIARKYGAAFLSTKSCRDTDSPRAASRRKSCSRMKLRERERMTAK